MFESLILSLLALPGPPAARPVQDSGALLIRAERVIVRPGTELENAAVLIENGMIVAVGADLVAPDGARTIEGKVVCAGFVDPWAALGVDSQATGHLATTPATRTVDALDGWGDRRQRGEALAGGVTSARVQSGMRALTGGIGAVVRTHAQGGVEGSELVILDEACMASTIGVTRGRTGDVFERVGEIGRLVGRIEAGQRYRNAEIEYRHALEEWQKAIEEKKAKLEKDFKKAKKARDKKKKEAEEKDKEFKDKKYKEDKKPKKPKYKVDDEALARVANGEIPLVVEVHRAEEIRALLEKTEKYGRVRMVIAGGTEALVHARELKKRHIPVIVWPAPLDSARADEYDAHDLGLAGDLSRAGVKVLIGSAGGRSLRELRLLASLAVGYGLDPTDALAAITSHPASVFDVRGRIGTVERGKDADLLVLDGDPLDTTARLRFVVSHGQVVVEQ